MHFKFLLTAMLLASTSFAGSFSCRDFLANEEDFKVVKADGKYSFQINGHHRVEKFLKSLELTELKSDGVLRFEIPEKDCIETKLSNFAVHCSSRDIKMAYSGNQTFNAGFVVAQIIDRTDIFGTGRVRKMVANAQSTIINIEAKKMVHADYDRWYPMDQCKEN